VKIISFDPPDDQVAARGLKSVHFRNLGQCVVLVGPNGGGKTRVLQLLQSLVSAAVQSAAIPSVPTGAADCKLQSVRTEGSPVKHTVLK